MGNASIKARRKYLLKVLETEYGSLKNVPDDHPNLLMLQELLGGRLQHLEEEPKQINPKEKLVPWNRIDVDLIYRLRKKKRIPLYQMADLISTTPENYNRIEKNLVQMTEMQLNMIAKVLCVSKNELKIKHVDKLVIERGV